MTSAVTADEFECPRELRQQVKEIGTNGASAHAVTPEPNPARPAEMMGEGKVASGPRRHRPARGGSGLTVGPGHAIGCIWDRCRVCVAFWRVILVWANDGHEHR